MFSSPNDTRPIKCLSRHLLTRSPYNSAGVRWTLFGTHAKEGISPRLVKSRIHLASRWSEDGASYACARYTPLAAPPGHQNSNKTPRGSPRRYKPSSIRERIYRSTAHEGLDFVKRIGSIGAWSSFASDGTLRSSGCGLKDPVSHLGSSGGGAALVDHGEQRAVHLRIARSAVAFEVILAGIIRMKHVSGFTLEVRERLAIMRGFCYVTAPCVLPASILQGPIDGNHTFRSQRHMTRSLRIASPLRRYLCTETAPESQLGVSLVWITDQTLYSKQPALFITRDDLSTAGSCSESGALFFCLQHSMERDTRQ